MSAAFTGEAAWLQALAARCGQAPGPGATRIVPGEGDPHARLVVVGEAPGEQEDRQGRPFVGRSGALLDTLLAEVGLTRGAVWITNVVKCRPTVAEGGRLRNRAPRIAEVRAWLPCLEAELERIRPTLVLALGAVAGRALLSAEFRITRDRGRVLNGALGGAPVLVSWHPSYLLRQVGPAAVARLDEARRDFALAARTLAEKKNLGHFE